MRLAHQPKTPSELPISAVAAINIAGPDEDERYAAGDVFARSERDPDERAEAERILVDAPSEITLHLAEGSRIALLPDVAAQSLGAH